jgi:hypothetical protein
MRAIFKKMMVYDMQKGITLPILTWAVTGTRMHTSAFAGLPLLRTQHPWRTWYIYLQDIRVLLTS